MAISENLEADILKMAELRAELHTVNARSMDLNAQISEARARIHARIEECTDPAPVPDAWRDLAALPGRQIDAIKALRRAQPELGLRAAKDMVEDYRHDILVAGQMAGQV